MGTEASVTGVKKKKSGKVRHAMESAKKSPWVKRILIVGGVAAIAAISSVIYIMGKRSGMSIGDMAKEVTESAVKAGL